jgi:hypothetical protein
MASKSKDDLVADITTKLRSLTVSNLRAVAVIVDNAVKSGRNGCGANRRADAAPSEPSPAGAPRKPRITFAA